MKITADTNLLVRAITEDDSRQAKLAQAALDNAESVAVAVPALCELVWVLSQGYRVPTREICAAIRNLMNAGNVTLNRPAVEAGLASLERGGDFADGAVAWEGRWLGSETFVTFDKKAAKILGAGGQSVRLI